MSNSKMLKRSVYTFVFPESAGISPFFRCQSAGALPLTSRRLGNCRAFLAAREALGPGSDDGERIRFDAVLTKVGVGGRGVGERCYITYFRHTSSHLVTHHVTSYFVYYFVQVLFRGLLPFRTIPPLSLFVSLAFPSLYLSSHSVPSHCCLPWPHLSFYVC